MPGELSVSRVLHAVPALVGEEPGWIPAPEAAADRSIIQEETNGLMLPPAGASRAETVFTTVGIVLLVILTISLLLTLVRHHRR